MSIPIPSAAS